MGEEEAPGVAAPEVAPAADTSLMADEQEQAMESAGAVVPVISQVPPPAAVPACGSL